MDAIDNSGQSTAGDGNGVRQIFDNGVVHEGPLAAGPGIRKEDVRLAR